MIDDSLPSFAPYQIVCLEHQQSYLYGEVIQVIESKNLCWMRPLLLAVFPRRVGTVDNFLEAKELLDLRFTSDVAYPVALFRPALDTEVIPLIGQLEILDETKEPNSSSKQKLRQFLEQIWQDNQEYFLATR
jgi:hypothetical protein